MGQNGRKAASDEVGPFLKWPGGKRWVAPLIGDIIRPYVARFYIEPFFGGGSVFFSLQPAHAILSDANPLLIECMRAVRDGADIVLRALARWSNSGECYEQVRKLRCRSTTVAAARLIYLVHTCWGGLYRVNLRGDFNVPFGGAGRPVFGRRRLKACSQVLSQALILCNDFEPVINFAKAGDAVYADPPYTTLGQNNGFVKYNEHLFSWKDQERLARVCQEAAKRKVFVIVSGMFHPSVLALYPGWWCIRVSRMSCVSTSIGARRQVVEALICSRRPASIEGVANSMAGIEDMFEIKGSLVTTRCDS